MSAPLVLVCFALRHEARFFRPAPGSNCRVAVTGIGRRNARRGLERALEGDQPALVLTCGYAGGLNPALKFGQVVFEAEGATELGALSQENMAEEWQVKNGEGAGTGEGRGTRAKGKGQRAKGRGLSGILVELGAVRGRFHEVDRVVVTAREKHDLWEATGADAVEMESAEIRRTCRERAIPAATIRVISDTAGEDLPLDFNQVSGPDQNLSYGKLAFRLVRTPALIGRLLQLQRRLNGAAQSLAAVLDGTLASLNA